ncbi:hypothetical protein FOA52_003755 [Chlamydomonas sp. UWO 241]|nr:hypothetical protein FOA52_003755 [Chlamydomonas sp. UWO 241]
MSPTLPSCAIFKSPVILPAASTSTAVALISPTLPSCVIFKSPVITPPSSTSTAVALTSPMLSSCAIFKSPVILPAASTSTAVALTSPMLPSCAIFKSPVILPAASTSTAVALTSPTLPTCANFKSPVFILLPAYPSATALMSPIIIEEHTIIENHATIMVLVFSSATTLFQFINLLSLWIFFTLPIFIDLLGMCICTYLCALPVFQPVLGKAPSSSPPPFKVLCKNKMVTDERACLLEYAPSSEETSRESSVCGTTDVPESQVDMHTPLLDAQLCCSHSDCALVCHGVTWWIELRTEFRVRTFAEVVSGVKATHVAVTAVNPMTGERIATARVRTYADAKGVPVTLIIA